MARGTAGYAPRERADLWRTALARADPTLAPEIRAEMHIRLADALIESDGPEQLARDEACDRALHAAWEVLTRDRYPYQWAFISNQLTSLALKRATRDARPGYVAEAIRYLEAALVVYDRTELVLDWAVVQGNLALAYLSNDFDPSNIQQALIHNDLALTVLTATNSPADWARTQMNRGSILGQHVMGDSATHAEEAIAADEQALQIFTFEAAPEKWADLHFNLGNAYRERLYGEPSANNERALYHYGAALVYSAQAEHPLRWAHIKRAMGWTHLSLGAHPDAPQQAIHLAEGLRCLQAALTMFPRQPCPKNGRIPR